MECCQKEVMMYGLDQCHGIIGGIIRDLDLEPSAFDVRLILSEAITNAYYHGNQGDCTKPIYVRYQREGNRLQLQIEDTGPGMDRLAIPEEPGPEELLDEGGRGLYLIRCYSDHVAMVDNVIHIDKTLV